MEDDNRLIDVIADAYKQYGIELCSPFRRDRSPRIMGGTVDDALAGSGRVVFFILTHWICRPVLHRSLCEEGRNGLIDIERRQWPGWGKIAGSQGWRVENSALSRIEARIELMDFRIGLPLVDRVRAKWF
ncbi:hypothetical protein [Thiomicrorhabdus sp.]|uniref:hypothetical protein n=1 Tax=Thiomicrorhabdus sp. TaxID=2039724 RepID=UPI0029C5FEF4|nr:hypothetical protein [Thiomicrorhabdus sp.]